MSNVAHEKWHKSSYSGGNGGDCVEVSEGPVTGLRDTRNRELGHLDLPAREWVSLLGLLRG
ncbi:DUF397 domain-containing protein [Nocardiopsis algeriensis]|uniref:DUF397 domain-containing protein n=1 Tax=Nocardiopsis algeriensis TaxID=1478215 RepID=A0A841ISN6_9ACTN|nr:DUF397 domain-containing protein [Nocardiopsis algeriensis]MBB6119208.1 hypothetical protein [Nocardiopsis algeriensis]